MSDASVAVVIPFFQRQRGLLRRAVASIFTEDRSPAAEVIVIDDGSPVRAADELAGLSVPAGSSIKLIEQANRGVAAARNAGLDAVAPSTRYVAFLDSDDMWTTAHLRKMCRAFAQGADFYFSDYHSPNE